MTPLDEVLAAPGRALLSGAPEGHDALILADIAGRGEAARGILHVARDDARMARLADALSVFAPDAEIRQFPAWDCLPYDRVSPNAAVVAERVDTLSRLLDGVAPGRPLIVLTTASAILQRVPPHEALEGAVFKAEVGGRLDEARLREFLVRNGFERSETVREPGEFALRGGLIDLFPPGSAEPVRLDLFGDELESVRTFDPMSQRTTGERDGFVLRPVSEAPLEADAIARFRAGYRELFGAVTNDPLYEAISEGRRYFGFEHWLPLFHDRLETLFDYLDGAIVSLDHEVDEALKARLDMIADYYDARRGFLEAQRGRPDSGAAPYRPLPPDRLYLDMKDLAAGLGGRRVLQFSPFAAPEGAASSDYRITIDLGGRRVHDFAASRARASAREGGAGETPSNVFDEVREAVVRENARGRRVAIAAFSAGTRDRLSQLLADHGVADIEPVETWREAEALPLEQVVAIVLPLDRGFTTPRCTVIGEQDVLGERLVRTTRRRRADNFIVDPEELAPGDLVVHVEHGIGRYGGLETLTVSGAPHDCLRVTYEGNDRLFVPVENVEVLSRYGSADLAAPLDRLGGAAWQSRKARMKRRLRDMADALIKIAAERALKDGAVLTPEPGAYDEFCARFPYDETEDQGSAIDETMDDLVSGRPMDRLVCGDVGFGKTEVALRAAFAAVSNGGQVAVVVPTTLLCRQHYDSFRNRFAGLPYRIEQLSRLVPARRAAEIRDSLAKGEIDIVIGTHALLGKSIQIKHLTLLVVDEEQRFGVAHKERLKQLKADVHILTLTATPIPRTLQMALTGVKDLSMIATPPVDRLAVRTFVSPYDPVLLREAIMREHFRGGQTFYVCPRIEDLPGVAEELRALAPEIKMGIAHGRLPTRELERVMTDFYDGAVELLLCTQIIESGLDIPRANTMIVHRADRFGLAQLYQLRGRIGRSKLRAYCYLTVPTDRALTETATRRLEVLQALDTLGAGFTLASHDLDIRGAGNLLGEEQSGHIREVGVELYQHMLEEAVAEARGGAATDRDDWTPSINVGTPVLIPETYVADLGIRLGLYRRIAALEDARDSESFAAELIDRFGALPAEVENLLKVVSIKRHCRLARIEKLDTGPKGAVVSFRDNTVPNPAGLIAFITGDAGRTKVRPDHSLVCRRDWESPKARLGGAEQLARQLAEIAETAQSAA